MLSFIRQKNLLYLIIVTTACHMLKQCCSFESTNRKNAPDQVFFMFEVLCKGNKIGQRAFDVQCGNILHGAIQNPKILAGSD